MTHNPSAEKTHTDWWKAATIYQIYPRSFKDTNGDGVGDLRGIIEKLDYIKDLGVDAIWISPIYKSPMVDHGYDISDYEQIDPLFGTMADFDELLRGIHKRGMKLLMDLVLNHTSDQHPWFLESSSSIDNPKRDWYIWKDGNDGNAPNNWASIFGGSAWQLDERTGQYYLHLFSKEQPDLNWRNPEVQEAAFTMARSWLERGVDGFRMDVANLILKAPNYPNVQISDDDDPSKYYDASKLFFNQDGIHEIFRALRKDVLDPYDAAIFGEMYDLTPQSALEYVEYSRKEFHLVYQYPIVGARGNWTLVKESVQDWYKEYEGRGWNCTTFSNHDSARPASVYGDESTESAKLIAAYLLTAPGTPFFLQGEELGMTNAKFDSIDTYQDTEMRGIYNERVSAGEEPKAVFEELARWSRDNARTPMQWSAENNAGFSTTTPWLPINPNYSNINAADQENDSASVLNFYRNILRMRHAHPALVQGSFTPLTGADKNPYVYLRSINEEKILVVLNTSPESVTMPELHDLANTSSVLFSNYEIPDQTKIPATLAPWQATGFLLSD